MNRVRIGKQDYTQPGIDGVSFVELKRFVDETGSFTELARFPTLRDIAIQQINYTTVAPGVIKAFHLHEKQWDVWFVPPSERVLIVLADCRSAGKIYEISTSLVMQTLRRYTMGDGTSRLLIIPPGVAHGYRNLMSRHAALFYMVSEQFTSDPLQCEEYRLPWDSFGSEIWDVRHG